MDLIEKLAPFVFLFIAFVIVSVVYIFGKVIFRTLSLLIRGKLFQRRHRARYEFLVDKKNKSSLTEIERKELHNLTESLGNLIKDLSFKKQK